MQGSAKLPKSERIGSERRIEAIFKDGRWGCVHPVKYCLLESEAAEGEPAAAVMFSVPKKRFKRAWKRNLIKRRMKESYRQSKQPLLEKLTAKGHHADIAFICAADEIPDYKTIDNAVRKILAKIMAGS